MNKQEILKKTLIIASIIKSKGGPMQSVTSLIHNNPELLLMTTEELEKKLYLIINNNFTYAILLIENNLYKWSILENNTFGPFITNSMLETNNNYIIEMIINSINKYIKFTNIDPNYSLEKKVELFKRINKNEEGYHLK